jgi:hypothetical protein
VDVMNGMLERLAEMLRRWQPPDADPDPDRDAGVPVPRPGAPTGRTSAFAVDEPDPDVAVHAIAHRGR